MEPAAMRLITLTPLFLLAIAIPATGSDSKIEVQESGNCRIRKAGIYENGYMKHITDLSVGCSNEHIGSTTVHYWYEIGDFKTPALTSNTDGTSYIGRTHLKLSGDIISATTYKNNGDTSEFIGILYNDARDLIGSWLVAKRFDIPASDLSKVRAKLTKSLQASDKKMLTQLSEPVWLFRINSDLTLVLEP